MVIYKINLKRKTFLLFIVPLIRTVINTTFIVKKYILKLKKKIILNEKNISIF